MTVSTSALRKGAPPARTKKTQSPIDTDPRPAEGKNRALQLMVPPDVFLAFSARAGQEFGVNPARVDKRTVDYFRTDILRELGKLKDAWPGFDYSTPKGCLELRPTRPLIAPSRPGAANRRPGDTEHTALRRHVFRVLADRPELLDPEHTDELAEAVKIAAARAGIPYDADTVTAAINAGRALAQAQQPQPETSDR